MRPGVVARYHAADALRMIDQFRMSARAESEVVWECLEELARLQTELRSEFPEVAY
jgi:hypothetical protein